MNTYKMLITHGDPLATIRQFIRSLWFELELDGLLTTQHTFRSAANEPNIISNPDYIDQINPFTPIMPANKARFVPEIKLEKPKAKIGGLLRPCESRALQEMAKLSSMDLHNFFTISFDCLGTFPEEDYLWRARRKGSEEELTKEALQFSHQGNIAAYRYRSACQLCSAPYASAADISIGVIGLPVRQYILVKAKDEETAKRYNLRILTDGKADQALIGKREQALARLVERNTRSRERLERSLSGLIPDDVNALIDQLESCGACHECLDNCPICAVRYPRRTESGRLRQEDVIQWMISCAGCGMCEQACPSKKPLSAIFGYIQNNLLEEGLVN